MDSLMEMIETSRNLSASTLKNYGRTLQRLQKNINQKDIELFLTNWEQVLSKIKNGYKKPYQLNLLSAYIVALDAYNQNLPSIDMKEGLVQIRKYQMKIKLELDETKYNQSKSEKEEENWVSFEKLHQSIKTNLKPVNKIIKRADEYSMKEAKIIMNWVISVLYTGSKENPPVRLDYNNMIVKTKEEYAEDHEDNQNYLVIHSVRTKYFIFAEYKTSKSYGKKSIKLAPELNKMINKWMQLKNKIKGIDSNYLLFNNKGGPVGESSMSNYINDAFVSTGKHITLNLIRHIFITDVANKLPLKQRKEIAEKMHHSLEMSLVYEKND